MNLIHVNHAILAGCSKSIQVLKDFSNSVPLHVIIHDGRTPLSVTEVDQCIAYLETFHLRPEYHDIQNWALSPLSLQKGSRI